MKKHIHLNLLQNELWGNAIVFRPSAQKACFFADSAPEAAPAAGDQKETVQFNLSVSEEARKRGAQAAAVIAQVKKDEHKYMSGAAIVLDLKKQLTELGFKIPSDMEFKNIDEVVDYVLAHADYSLQPLTLGDIHIEQDAARIFKNHGVEFIFDEVKRHIDFKFPDGVEFFDLDGNRVKIMDETDATHFVDVSISYDDENDTFVVIVGKDDSTQIRRTLKYKMRSS